MSLLRKFAFFLFFYLTVLQLTDQKIISAVGRFASIGDVYDMTKDEFTTENIFEDPLPLNSSLITQTKLSPRTSKTIIVRTLMDKVDLCGIEPAQAVSILDGTIIPTGSSAYLQQNPQNMIAVIEGAVAHTMKTTQYELNLHDHSLPQISRSVMQKTEGTHVVIGITYGGTVIASVMDSTPRNVEKASREQAILVGLQTLNLSLRFSIQPHQHFQVCNDFTSSNTIFQDPLIYSSMINNIQFGLFNVPGLKVVPLTYHLAPIVQFTRGKNLSQSLSASVGKNSNDVSNLLLQRIIKTFDSIFSTKTKLLKLANLPFLSISDVHLISAQKEEMGEFAEMFKYNLSRFLRGIRTGTTEELTLINFLKDTNKALKNFTATISNFEEKYKSNTAIYNGVVAGGLDYLGRGIMLDEVIMKSIDKPLFLLLWNTTLREASKESWQENFNLLVTTFNKPWNKCAAVDCDFHPNFCSNINKTTIYQYIATKLVSIDVYQDLRHHQDLPSFQLRALGRSHQIGDLFDANRGKFVDGSLFKSGSLQKLQIQRTNNTNFGPSLTITNTWNQFFKALEVPEAQQFSSLYRSKEAGIARNFEVIRGHSKSTGYSLVQTYVDHQKSLNLTIPEDRRPSWINRVSLKVLESASGVTHFVQQIDVGVITLIGLLSEENGDNHLIEARKLEKIVDQYNPEKMPSSKTSRLTELNSTYLTLHNGEDLSKNSFYDSNKFELYLKNRPATLPRFFQPVAYILYPLANLQTKFGFLPTIPSLRPLPSSIIVARSVAALDILGDMTIQREVGHLQIGMDLHKECMLPVNFQNLKRFRNRNENETLTWATKLKDYFREFPSGEISAEKLTEILNEFEAAFPGVEEQKSLLLTSSDINERLHLCQLCRQSSVRFISSPTDFNQAVIEDSKIEWMYYMYFRQEWMQTMSLRWREIQSKFFGSLQKRVQNITNGSCSPSKFYVIDCELFVNSTSTICSNISRPTIQELRKGLLVTADLDELLQQEKISKPSCSGPVVVAPTTVIRKKKRKKFLGIF